jgi:hypothetical protein
MTVAVLLLVAIATAGIVIALTWRWAVAGPLPKPAGRAVRAHRAGTPRRLSDGHPAGEHLGRLAGTGFHRGRPHRAARSVADEPARPEARKSGRS